MLEHELLCIKWGSAKESSWIWECLLAGKKAFLWTTENSAMSGSRASQEHEQRPCVDMVDRSGHLYWMIRIPASQHLRRMGATATSVSCVESVSGVGPSHTLRMGSTPSSWYGTQHDERNRRPTTGQSCVLCLELSPPVRHTALCTEMLPASRCCRIMSGVPGVETQLPCCRGSTHASRFRSRF